MLEKLSKQQRTLKILKKRSKLKDKMIDNAEHAKGMSEETMKYFGWTI